MERLEGMAPRPHTANVGASKRGDGDRWAVVGAWGGNQGCPQNLSWPHPAKPFVPALCTNTPNAREKAFKDRNQREPYASL